MIYLTLKAGNDVLKTYIFEDNHGIITIGRNENNDVVIKDNPVSGNHARIESLDNGFFLSDLQSKNGVFVNRKFISSHWLASGDVITIGKHTIEFLYEMENQHPMDQTMFLDMESYKKMRADSFLDVALGIQHNDVNGELVFLNGGSEPFKLTKKITTIGKKSGSDIVAGGFLLGKTAATITKGVEGHYIAPAGGFIKPRVNGKKIKETILLKDSAVIQIGTLRMKYITR